MSAKVNTLNKELKKKKEARFLLFRDLEYKTPEVEKKLFCSEQSYGEEKNFYCIKIAIMRF